jgi:hypothetical protein
MIQRFSFPGCARVNGTGAPRLFCGRPTVSCQGIAFDYSSPAELYLSRRGGRHTDYSCPAERRTTGAYQIIS